jgi:hypothetical protein
MKKAQVAELCTSELAQSVLTYTIETLDPAKPWIQTPMVTLLPQPSVTPPETPAESPEPESEPTVTQTVSTNNSESESVPSSRPLRVWRVVIRTTVEDKVHATDIASAIETARGKYQQPAEVVGVMEE